MTVYDIDGNEVTTRKRRTLRPAPDQVIVLRKAIETHYPSGLEKSPDAIEREERENIVATVARIGATEAERERLWFKEEDEVIIAPHVFSEIGDSTGVGFWLGPIKGIKGVFEEVEND